MSAGIGFVLACVVCWALLSARLRRWSVTAPIVLALCGLVLGSTPDSPVHVNIKAGSVRELVEISLALILFTDASRISAHWFQRRPSLVAARLLLIALPLMLVTGVLAALPLFHGAELAVLAVIAASLAPTDAALGASVMDDERIPLRLREVINVESGLNDGLATPFVLFFIAIASAEGANTSVAAASVEAIVDILVAIAFGGVIGWLGGRLLNHSQARAWALPDQIPLVALGLALIAYFSTSAVGGTGFIAAFVAGVTFGSTVTSASPTELVGFSQRVGSLLSYFVWFIFGAAFLRPAFEQLTWQLLAYAALSLTVVRMLPVSLSLLGCELGRDDRLLIGWLGPRGLASIVFALIAFDQLAPSEGGTLVANVVTITVGLSVLAHGLSAGPIAARYAARHLPASSGETPVRD